MEKLKVIQRNYRIKEKLYNEIKEVCRDNDDTPSQVIRRSFVEYIKKYKKNENL